METNRHPSIQEKLDFFEHNHLPEPLFSIARACSELAHGMADSIESHPQVAIGLQELLAAKDCFVRAAVAAVNRSQGNSNQGTPLSRPNEVI